MHDMKLTHTDLKPENMLFKYRLLPNAEPNDGQEADISLIDFGSATFEHEVMTLAYLNFRFLALSYNLLRCVASKLSFKF